MRKSTVALSMFRAPKEDEQVNAKQNHNERKEEANHSNKNIDVRKSKNNILLKKSELPFDEAIEEVIKNEYKGARAVRKDAVKLIEITVQFGGDYGSQGTASRFEKVLALKAAYQELCNRYGEQNVVSAAIHLDETNPHLHVDIVPIMPDGGLSAKRWMGSKSDMHRTQEEFLEAMQKAVPDAGFERKSDQTLNGMEQKQYEFMTKLVREREEKVAKLEEDFKASKKLEKHKMKERENALISREKEVKEALRGERRQLNVDKQKFTDEKEDFKEKQESLKAERQAFEQQRIALYDSLARQKKEMEAEIEEIRNGLRDDERELKEDRENLDKSILDFNKSILDFKEKFKEEKEEFRKEKEEFENKKSNLMAEVEEQQKLAMEQVTKIHQNNQLWIVTEKDKLDAEREALTQLTTRLDRALANVPQFNSNLIKWAEAQPHERRENVDRLVNMAYRQGVTEPIREIRQNRETPQAVERPVRRLERSTSLKRDELDDMLKDIMSGDIEDFGKAVDLLDEDKGFYL